MSFEETGLMVDSGTFTSPSRTVAYRVVGVDAGNRQVKVARSGNEVAVIPSVIKHLSQRDGLPVAPSSYSIQYESGDWTGSPYLRGKRWLVGQLASDMQGSATFKGEKADVMPELVMAALAMVVGNGVVSVGELKLCLPDDEPGIVSQVRSALKGIHHITTPDGSLTLHIKNVAIELEGVSAFKWLKSAGFFAAPNRLNGTLDIGGGNSSAQLFAPSGYPILETRKVLPGMGELARMIATGENLRGIESKGNSPKLELILDGIADGSFCYGLSGKSFKADFDDCFPKWLEALKTEIKNHWQAYLPQTAEIAIIGGAAPLMNPLVESSKGRFKISPESAIVTAKGMVM